MSKSFYGIMRHVIVLISLACAFGILYYDKSYNWVAIGFAIFGCVGFLFCNHRYRAEPKSPMLSTPPKTFEELVSKIKPQTIDEEIELIDGDSIDEFEKFMDSEEEESDDVDDTYEDKDDTQEDKDDRYLSSEKFVPGADFNWDDETLHVLSQKLDSTQRFMDAQMYKGNETVRAQYILQQVREIVEELDEFYQNLRIAVDPNAVDDNELDGL